MSALHERLPLRIAREDYATWLDGEPSAASALMRAPAEDFYAHHPVSQRINTGGRGAPDDAALIEPVDAPNDAPGAVGDPRQPSLF